MKNKLKIFVNIITIIRLIGSFVLIPIYKIYGLKTVSIFTLTLFLTDLIDGFLARKFKVSTFFGSTMDGLSDKCLGIISLAVLSSVSHLMIIPLILEILILIALFIAYKNGGNIKSSKIGKIKTWALGISVVGSFIVALYNYNTIELISYLGAFATTFGLLTLIDYIAHAYHSFKLRNKIVVIKDRERKSIKEIFRDAWDCDFYLKHKNDSTKILFYK